MRTAIDYQNSGHQIPFDEPDEFELTNHEQQIQLLEFENRMLHNQNSDLQTRLQDLEKIIAEYADGLKHD